MRKDDKVAAAFALWQEAYKRWVAADRRVAEENQNATGAIPQALEDDVAALKDESDRLLAAAMEALRKARAAMP
jgi:hypothetical protein